MTTPNIFSVASLCFCLSIGHTLSAQVNIQGTIEDQKGDPVPYVNVLLLQSQDSSLVIGTISKVDGAFALKDLQRGSYLLQTSMVGYVSRYQKTSIGSTDQVLKPIVMIEDTRQLDEVVVSARKPLYEKQIDRTVVNVQSSITSSGKTALQVIQKSPGVSVNQQNKTISMRGKQGVLVMINGRMTRLPIDAVVQMLDGMSAANIEKIELITTPPAKYDAEGDAGIINIVMVESPDRGTNGNIGLSAGYNKAETLGANFNLNHRNNRLNYFVDYSIRSDRNQEIWIETRELDDVSFDRSVTSDSERDILLTVQNLRAGLEYELSPKTSIRALLTAYRRDWNANALTEVINVASMDSIILTSMNIVEDNVWQSISGAVGFTHQINDHQQISIDFDYLAYSNDNPSQYDNNTSQPETDQPSETGIEVTKKTPINFKVAKLDYSNQITDKFSIDLGFKTTLSKFNNRVGVRFFEQGEWITSPEFTNTSDLDEKIWAAYLSWSWVASERFTINGGLRYEFTDSYISTPEQSGLVDREFGNFFPSLFMSHKFNDESQLQLAYARRINRPTFNDMAPFVYFTGPNSIYAGNPALLPAITDGIDLTYQLKQWWVSMGYSSTGNSIGWLQPELDPVTNEQVFRSHNLEYLNTLSFSTSLPLNIASWWEMQNDVTVSYQTFKTKQFENNFEERVYTVTLNSTSNFTLPKNYSIEVSGNYQNNVLYGIWENRPMGQVDIGFRKELNNGKGILTLAFSDIFHTNIWEWETNLPEANAYLWGLYDQNLRSIQLTYTRSFGNKKLKSVNVGSGSGDERGRVN